MIFHENRLLADDSHVISCLIVFRKLGKMSQNLSSAAVVIGDLRVNMIKCPPVSGDKQCLLADMWITRAKVGKGSIIESR